MPLTRDPEPLHASAINTVLYSQFFSALLNIMTRLIEGTNYKRREGQPTPDPPKSNEDVDYMLCSDPGNDNDAQVGHGRKKRSRPIGLNICLEGV